MPCFAKRLSDYIPDAHKVAVLSHVKGSLPNTNLIQNKLDAILSNKTGESIATICLELETRIDSIKQMPAFKDTSNKTLRNATLKPHLESLLTYAIKNLPENYLGAIRQLNEVKISDKGRATVSLVSDALLLPVSKALEAADRDLIARINADKSITADMASLYAAMQARDTYLKTHPILSSKQITTKLESYADRLNISAREKMAAAIDQLSAPACNQFFANLEKHRGTLLDSKAETANNFKEIMGNPKFCATLIQKLATASFSSTDLVNAVEEIQKQVTAELHSHTAYEATLNAYLQQQGLSDHKKTGIAQDFKGQQELANAFAQINKMIAKQMLASGKQPKDYPINDMSVLYSLAQNIASVIENYTNKFGPTTDKSESQGHMNKMSEFERIQRAVAAEIRNYNGTNCATIFSAAQKIIQDSLTNKFDKYRPLTGNGTQASDGLKGYGLGTDNARDAMRDLNQALQNSTYQTLLKMSDGQQYVQAQSLAQPKPLASAASIVTAQRTPPTPEALAKASQTATAVSAAAKPPISQRARDAVDISPPKLK